MLIVEMILVVGVFSIISEIFIFDPLIFNKFRRQAVIIPSLLMLFMIGGLLTYGLNFWSILIIAMTIFRLFNMLRIRKSRMHYDYLLSSTRSTSLALIAAQLLITGLYIFYAREVSPHVSRTGVVESLILLQLIFSFVLLVSCYRNIRKTKPLLLKSNVNDSQLPTLSICIPARNETGDLEDCLAEIVAIDYPKLEIIVLDDCSQGKYTSDTIKSFAHSGVRFIPGVPPKKHWLAKNWAYSQLLQEASGEYILFCGVDVRFSADSLRKIMQLLLQKDKSMMSIMPDYNDAKFQIRLIQAMRYFWELAPPRRYFNRPPVLSTCWVCKTDDLKKIGGFNAATRTIVPESFFARTFVKKDKYSFMRSNGQLGVRDFKKLSEQRNTFIRVRYPQLHKKPQLVFILSFMELILWVAPFILLFIGLDVLRTGDLFWDLNAVTCVLLITSYIVVTISAFGKKYLVTSLVFPVAIVVDVVLMHVSMYEYEMSVVSWKSRNVCIPTMHFTPSPSRN
ncbi:MAG TPA: glycosyltransferase [Candidatus Saccharimonadales bacterium]|nr:glycosyltransferase [Candidatus Saccharimonadales bacterium]